MESHWPATEYRPDVRAIDLLVALDIGVVNGANQAVKVLLGVVPQRQIGFGLLGRRAHACSAFELVLNLALMCLRLALSRERLARLLELAHWRAELIADRLTPHNLIRN